MAFSPFKKSKCVITDDLFIEVFWEEGKSPEDDSELFGIIEGLDHQYLHNFQHTIEESLPYLTFLQAEILFQALQDFYGSIQLKRVAICHMEGKEVVSEGEVFASPFIIDQRYQNLLLPLIQSIMTEPDFQSYTYQEKREYFLNQIYPVYKNSLGIKESALPLFPEEGERIAVPLSRQASPIVMSKPKQDNVAQNVSKPTSLKRVYLWLVLLGIVATGSVISSGILFSQLAKQSSQAQYLYQELGTLQTLVTTEHEIDVFSRYFLPNYYSGNKENLFDFLSEGDAKYTTPKEGILQSVILEQLTYDSESKEYNVVYVLSVKQEEQSTSTRLHFTVQQSDTAKYGYEVTTEPKETAYVR